MRRALVVCPATVLSHWITELHEWAPQLRVVILHRCAYAFNDVSGSSGEKTQVTLPDSCVHIVLYCIVCCRKTFKLKNCAQDPYARRTAALQSVTYLFVVNRESSNFCTANLRMVQYCGGNILRRIKIAEDVASAMRLGLWHSGRGTAHPQPRRRGNKTYSFSIS